MEGKYGLFDASGSAILAPEYDTIKRFIGFIKDEDDGPYNMTILGFELTRDGKKGFADLAGKIIFPPQYDKLDHFEQDNARYMHLHRSGKQGLADEITGELIVPIEYDNITWRGDYIELKRGDSEDRIGWDRSLKKITGTVIKGTGRR